MQSDRALLARSALRFRFLLFSRFELVPVDVPTIQLFAHDFYVALLFGAPVYAAIGLGLLRALFSGFLFAIAV